VVEGPNERRSKSDMSLNSDMRQNIQSELDFSSAPTGEARKAGREENESLGAMNAPESPARTDRLMEEICDGEYFRSLGLPSLVDNC
jgi:RNA-directed DNA polymerase